MEENVAKALTAGTGKKARRYNLIRIDIRDRQWHRHRLEAAKRFHHRFPEASRRTSVRRPVIAAAAAITGLIRWVRASIPCRPTKLRLEVEAQRCRGPTKSPFMPTHIEQPADRHSKPASMNTRFRPSASACCLTWVEPGTTAAGIAARAPLTISAAARRSSIRLLVHEPMNTLSMAIPYSG